MFIFLILQPPSWKLKKITIFQQWFDQSSRNLACWCKIDFSATPAVENFDSQKSNMVYGHHFENYSIISLNFIKFRKVMQNRSVSPLATKISEFSKMHYLLKV